MHLDNEQSLVAAAQAGDSDAFVTLLNQYSRHIYRLGVSITGNHHDAEDVLQEASLNAYRAIAEFQGNSRFYTWLVRIAVNVALGKLRACFVERVLARRVARKRRWQLHPSRNRELG